MGKESKRDMREKFLEHLSKEIETTMNNIYLFRTKSAFTVWIGPFILLGSVVIATKSNISIITNAWVWGAILLSFLSYMALGYGAGRIEKANWNRVDNLRAQLADLSQSEDKKIDIKEFQDSKMQNWIINFYILVFFAVAILFICATIIIANLQVDENRASASTRDTTETLIIEFSSHNNFG